MASVECPIIARVTISPATCLDTLLKLRRMVCVLTSLRIPALTAQRFMGRVSIDDARILAGARQYPSEYFGHVDNAARKLVDMASRSGVPQHVDFNGTQLIAMPGQKPADVVKDWQDARSAISNPAGSLAYDVKSRIGDEVARNEMAALAKQPARPFTKVLADLQARVDRQDYRDTFMAGLCELKHPGEIRAFVDHFMPNPPKKDASQSTQQARETARTNIEFWVTQREGAQPGTEKNWMAALDQTEKSVPIQHEVLAGTSIDGAIRDMLAEANRAGQAVQATFNGTTLIANPGDTREQVKAPFNKSMEQARVAAEQRATTAADQRTKKIEAFTAQGGKIIESPPAKMKFKTGGLVPAGSMFNPSSRPLQLITPAQLKALPEGTKLTSISGDSVIKGIDSIDGDTRGGLLAFGFLQ